MAASKKAKATNTNPTYELTQEGYDALVAERDELIAKKPEIVNRVTVAREQGDLKENAEYHASREELGRVQGRIDEIDTILKNAEISTKAGKKNVVALGTKVTLTNVDTNKSIKVTVVGANESDFAAGKLSCDSPIGKAIMGKKSGTTVTVHAPKGDSKYTVSF